MSILKKKKFLIPVGLLLVGAGVAVAVFWPHVSAWQRYGAAQDKMREVSAQAEAEFPEIADYAEFKKSLMPENNGWADIQKAIELFNKIEEDEEAVDDKLAIENESDEEASGFRDAIWYLDGTDAASKQDKTIFERYVLKTAPILVHLKKAATYKTIVPPRISNEKDDIGIPDVFNPFRLAFQRTTMLQLLGRNKQAEDEYYLALKLASLFHCDNTFIGAMVHVGIKGFIAGEWITHDRMASIKAMKTAIGYAESETIDPAVILVNELALKNRTLSEYVELSITEKLATKKQSLFWDDEEDSIGQHWTIVADEAEAGLAFYKTGLDAALSLRDKPIDYFDLNAVYAFLEPVNREIDIESFYANTSDLLAKYALLQPLALRVIEVRARLRLLKLESGPLNENREAVEALVKKHLPQFVVIWDKPVGDEDSSDWEGDMVLLVEPAAEFKVHAYLSDRLPSCWFIKEEKSETSSE